MFTVALAKVPQCALLYSRIAEGDVEDLGLALALFTTPVWKGKDLT